MATYDALFNKLNVVYIPDNSFNVYVEGRPYYCDDSLNVVAVQAKTSILPVEPGINLFDDFIGEQPMADAIILGKKYCMNCGSGISGDTPLCPGCGAIISHDKDKFTRGALGGVEIAVLEISQDGINERANIARYLVESPLISNLSGRTLEFQLCEEVQRHIEDGGNPWRFRGIANHHYFKSLVPNLNIRYSFGIQHMSTDLVKFLKVMEKELENIGDDEVVQLDESMVNQLRCSYVANNRGITTFMNEVVDVGAFPDHDLELFCQAVPMLIDKGVATVSRTGEVIFNISKMVNISKKEFEEVITLDSYTPSIKPGVRFAGYYESTGVWYNE